MKSTAKSSLYFSAYPLKAIKDLIPGTESGTGNLKVSSRMRISPMANPYKQPLPEPKTVNPSTGTDSPYLRAVLAGNSNNKANNQAKVAPMDPLKRAMLGRPDSSKNKK